MQILSMIKKYDMYSIEVNEQIDLFHFCAFRNF